MCWFFNFSQKQMGNWLPAEVWLLFELLSLAFTKGFDCRASAAARASLFSGAGAALAAVCRLLTAMASPVEQALGARLRWCGPSPERGRSSCDAHGLVAPGVDPWTRDQNPCLLLWQLDSYHWPAGKPYGTDFCLKHSEFTLGCSESSYKKSWFWVFFSSMCIDRYCAT